MHSNISGKSKTNEFSELDAEDEEIDGIERSNDTQWLKELVTELHDVISHRHMDQVYYDATSLMSSLYLVGNRNDNGMEEL